MFCSCRCRMCCCPPSVGADIASGPCARAISSFSSLFPIVRPTGFCNHHSPLYNTIQARQASACKCYKLLVVRRTPSIHRYHIAMHGWTSGLTRLQDNGSRRPAHELCMHVRIVNFPSLGAYRSVVGVLGRVLDVARSLRSVLLMPGWCINRVC